VSKTKSPVIVALDVASVEACEKLLEQLDPALCRVKVGMELFTRAGPVAIDKIHQHGFDVFLDLKYHDIPNTVASACRSAAELGVWMVNVHACGGTRMLQAARENVPSDGRTRLIAVTVLTSMDAEDLQGVGVDVSPADQVMRLATQTHECKLDGVVCSAKEAASMRRQFGADFLLVTPGVRPAGSDAGDQRRVVTPQQAIDAGSDYLVIGRPITAASDPAVVLRGICQDLGL